MVLEYIVISIGCRFSAKGFHRPILVVVLFRRKFLAAHPSNLWLVHKSRPAKERCTYEVIAQGAPCKLYFDLEFSRPLNPSSDGDCMVRTLIAAVAWALEETYGRCVAAADVLILDASTENKFSQHLIFQMRGCAFVDNIHAGNFVKYVAGQLKSGAVPGLGRDDQEALLVNNDRGESVSFCDLGVYTKNRNFRLFLSTKFGKNAPLLVSPTNAFIPRPDRSPEEAIFKASLITFFDDDDDDVHQDRHLLCYETASTAADGASAGDPSRQPHQPATNSVRGPRLNGYQHSPWMEIDRFIAHLVSPAGSIRQWVYYDKSQTVVYDIHGDYRYCARIGRQHKRNHIKYVVSLADATYYQSCFDADCAALRRPPPLPIPEEHLPWRGLLLEDDPPVETLDGPSK